MSKGGGGVEKRGRPRRKGGERQGSMEEINLREQEPAAATKLIHIGEFVLRPLSEGLLSPHDRSLSYSCRAVH